MSGEKIVRRKLADGTIKEYRYKRRRPRVLPASLGSLIQDYRQSPEFAKLKPNTKRTYLRAMGHMHPLYDVAVADIKKPHVVKLRNEFTDTPAIANQIVAVFSILMQWAVDMEYRTDNPARRVQTLQGGEFVRWPDEALDFAMENLPECFRRAIVLALYTGQRQGDIVAMKWSDYDGEGIAVAQEKTGAKVWIPCHSVLRGELDRWREDRNSTHILVNRMGRPWQTDSFSTGFSVAMKKHPELKGLVFHGLRKTAAARLAEAGCSPHEIAAITGHKTMQMILHYTSQADQRHRASAAIVKLQSLSDGKRRKRGDK